MTVLLILAILLIPVGLLILILNNTLEYWHPAHRRWRMGCCPKCGYKLKNKWPTKGCPECGWNRA